MQKKKQAPALHGYRVVGSLVAVLQIYRTYILVHRRNFGLKNWYVGTYLPNVHMRDRIICHQWPFITCQTLGCIQTWENSLYTLHITWKPTCGYGECLAVAVQVIEIYSVIIYPKIIIAGASHKRKLSNNT